MNARRLLLAGAAVAAVGAAMPAAALAQTQAVSGTVLDVVTLTPPVAVVMPDMSPGSATPATAATTFTVTANRCYSLTIADPTNLGYMKFLTNSFTQRLQWKLTAAADTAYTDLLGTAANIATGAAATPATGTGHGVTYRQRLAGEIVPSGAYTTTATVTAAAATCV